MKKPSDVPAAPAPPRVTTPTVPVEPARPDPVTPVEAPEPVPGTDAPDPDPDTADSDPTGTNAEAAKWRTKLRAAEAELETLRGRVALQQRRNVEAAVSALTDPADLWRDGLELADVLGPDGDIDPAKVTDAEHAVATAHPAWRRPPADLGQGVRSSPIPVANLDAAIRNAVRGGH